jgi:hypothetical protein
MVDRTDTEPSLVEQTRTRLLYRHRGAEFEIADCDLKPVARSAGSGSLREVADPAEKAVALELIPAPAIQKRILVVRERQVMLDEDLADLYGVETRRLIEQVKRNSERFPADFMFQLTKEEAAALRSQTATSGAGHGGRRYAPYVFTEQGVAMLSGVLRSERAVAVNIAIMRAFVELRRAATSYAAIEKRLEELERETTAKLGQHDQQLGQIFQALRQLISPPPRPRRRVGFRLPEDDE